MLSRTTFKVQSSSKFKPEKFNLHPNQFKVQFNSTQLNSFQVQFKPNLGQFSDFSHTSFCVLVFVLRPPNEWEESCTLTGAQLFRHFHHFHLFFQLLQLLLLVVSSLSALPSLSSFLFWLVERTDAWVRVTICFFLPFFQPHPGTQT